MLLHVHNNIMYDNIVAMHVCLCGNVPGAKLEQENRERHWDKGAKKGGEIVKEREDFKERKITFEIILSSLQIHLLGCQLKPLELLPHHMGEPG